MTIVDFRVLTDDSFFSITVSPLIRTGSIIVSIPILTSGPINVVVGSIIVTPFSYAQC